VLVSGTKIGSLRTNNSDSSTQDLCTTMEELKPEGQEEANDEQKDDDTDSTVSSTFDQGSPTLQAFKPELDDTQATMTSTSDSIAIDNPYAGSLKNQKICRLIQVQADVVEKDGTGGFDFSPSLQKQKYAHFLFFGQISF
jgi:hypothetical protein